MNINKWLPTKKDRKEAREAAASVIKGIFTFVCMLAVISIFIWQPMILATLVAIVILLLSAAFLWSAFAPIRKEEE